MIDGMIARRRARRMLDLLAEERRAILAGAPEKLARLARKRETAETDLMAVSPREGDGFEELLSEIRMEAERNRRLLTAFMEGAAEARRRLDEMDAARADMGAYDAQGDRLASPTPPARRETRA